MQNVVLDRPYEFIPPYRHKLWPAILQKFLPWHLNREYGIASVECRHVDRLAESVRAGHGIVLAGNHSRPCDPLVLGSLVPHIGTPLHAMGSWHLFMESRFQCFMARRCGAFSVYREGMDRQAVNAAIEILEQASRPLIIFPEGVVTRTNDQMTDLLEGVTLITRTAAKRRAKANPAKQVVVHPIAIKYYFRGDVAATIDPVLTDIERRLSWRPQRHLPLGQRAYQVGEALLALKEIQYLGHPREGALHDRLTALVERLVAPLEEQWAGGAHDGHIVSRVKRLRSAILPDMIAGKVDAAERHRRWEHLEDIYLAQQLAWYPADYIQSYPSAERLLETVEKFEEDLTDVARVHRPLHVVIQVGEAFAVSPERDRSETVDPVLSRIRREVQGMLDQLVSESPALDLGELRVPLLAT